MKIGTYYYPEQWPREQWARDFDNIAKMGLQIVHLGEFAWGTIEPERGRYELDWLADCLQLTSDRGLDVILCTPTAVVPVWLAAKHPDALFTGQRFGGRRHANHMHPIVKERSATVARAMAKRFGEHARVIGWQIDNELSGGTDDQSPVTLAAFRDWLRRKYGTIAGLNRAWGCAFWNTFYTDFEQIKYAGTRDPHYRNPHERLDAWRFLSSTHGDYVKLQADELRPRIGNRWITTNFMPFFPDIDPADCAGSISLYSWDSYPITGRGSGFKDEQFRLAEPDALAFTHDQMRGFTGRWGLMEVQPGQINWSGYPVRPLPGAIRLLLWQAIAHQAEFVTVYRFRQPRFGGEMWHDGLVQWDGTTPSPGGEQFAQVIREIKQIESVSSAVKSGDYSTLAPDASVTTVGVMHEHDQLYCYLAQPQAKRWNQPRLVTQYHAAVERLGLNAQVVRPTDDWSSLPILIVAGLQMADDALIEKLKAYVASGGHLITTARSFVLDKHGHAPEGLYEHRLFDLIGSTIRGYDSLPEETFGQVEFIGADGVTSHRWGIWCDLIEPGDGVEVLATYADQHYAGAAAVVRNTYGKGSVTHVGPIDEGSLADAIVERAARAIGAPIQIVPMRTKLHRLAGGMRVFLNFNLTPASAPAPTTAKFLIGQKQVEPAGVAVWKE